MIQFHTDDHAPVLHHYDGLLKFLDTPVGAPPALTASELRGLAPAERDAYDRTRIQYLSGGIVIETPQVSQAKRLLTQTFALNVARVSGHAGLMLSGQSTLGKTTTAMSLMRYAYGSYRRQFPDFADYDRVPIAYIDVPSASTGKRLLTTFADFYGMTVTTRDSTSSLQSRVIDMIRTVGTQLIVVDELHNLASRSIGAGESVDLLKGLSNELRATFVYAGINLTESDGILGGARGNQISSRFSVVKMAPLELSNPEDRKTWHRLLMQFEKLLPLVDQETGSLTNRRMSDYLYGRTSGGIGSLSRLLTGAALEAIQDDALPECITEDLLETHVIDHTAETKKLSTRRKYSLEEEPDFS